MAIRLRRQPSQQLVCLPREAAKFVPLETSSPRVPTMLAARFFASRACTARDGLLVAAALLHRIELWMPCPMVARDCSSCCKYITMQHTISSCFLQKRNTMWSSNSARLCLDSFIRLVGIAADCVPVARQQLCDSLSNACCGGTSWINGVQHTSCLSTAWHDGIEALSPSFLSRH